MYIEVSEETRRQVRAGMLRHPAWSMIILFLLGALPLAPVIYATYQEYRAFQRKRLYAVVEGVVIDRYRAPFLKVLERPVYVIQPENELFTVKAVLAQNKLFDFPSRIQFHFSGDRTEEVRLVGETDPQRMLIVAGILPCGLPLMAGVIMVFELRRSRRSGVE
ncbi:MAG: hypothetical protein JNN07_00625 [Verrucomicrobiales bacterium]|nr:hypothetical protein [Verrucomicrobiales bacterium]